VPELLISGQENYGKSDAVCVAEVKDMYQKLKLEVYPCPYHLPWSQPFQYLIKNCQFILHFCDYKRMLENLAVCYYLVGGNSASIPLFCQYVVILDHEFLGAI